MQRSILKWKVDLGKVAIDETYKKICTQNFFQIHAISKAISYGNILLIFFVKRISLIRNDQKLIIENK